jgi:hypothetical protein
MGTECYDRPPPAPYSFRGGLLWSFRELAKFSLPIRPTKPTPNNPPEARSPQDIRSRAAPLHAACPDHQEKRRSHQRRH